jgi:hypothetical protein
MSQDVFGKRPRHLLNLPLLCGHREIDCHSRSPLNACLQVVECAKPADLLQRRHHRLKGENGKKIL